MNINGIENHTRLRMFGEFLHSHDVDVALLQEVTNGNNLSVKGYQTIVNVGTLGRGTAIIHKPHLKLHRIQRIPTGRGIAAYLGNTCLVNIYAPSGNANRAERENFFNTEVVELIPQSPTQLIMGGDFNCVLSNKDCTDNRTCSRAAGRLTHGLRLKDAWDSNRNPKGYTHYTAHGAARLDRFYLTDDLLAGKQGAETIAAAFTDHLAVLIRLKLTAPNVHRGRGRWRMNTTLLNDGRFRLKIRDSWEEWKQHIHRFPDIVQWWVHYVKQKVKRLFIQEGAERNADRRRMEEFYYSAIYDVLQIQESHADKMLKLKKLKAKIVRLNSPYRQRVMIDTEEHDQITGEYPSLHHLLKRRKRQEGRLIRQI